MSLSYEWMPGLLHLHSALPQGSLGVATDKADSSKMHPLITMDRHLSSRYVTKVSNTSRQ